MGGAPIVTGNRQWNDVLGESVALLRANNRALFDKLDSLAQRSQRLLDFRNLWITTVDQGGNTTERFLIDRSRLSPLDSSDA